jgi:hypothetical protein
MEGPPGLLLLLLSRRLLEGVDGGVAMRWVELEGCRALRALPPAKHQQSDSIKDDCTCWRALRARNEPAGLALNLPRPFALSRLRSACARARGLQIAPSWWRQVREGSQKDESRKISCIDLPDIAHENGSASS